jgi:hypothetical protein
MDFKQFLERSLYHGTIIDNLDSIRSIGLQPDIGDFVKHAYGGDYEAGGANIDDEEPAIFLTDKPELEKALTAMKHHIAKKLNKGWHDVTERDVVNHGLLIKCKDEDNSIPRYDPYHHQPATPGGEENDYISTGVLSGDQFIRGNGIIRAMRAAGVDIESPKQLMRRKTQKRFF